MDEAFARAKLACSNVTLAYTVEAAPGPLGVSEMMVVRYTAGRIIGLAGELRPLRLHHERNIFSGDVYRGRNRIVARDGKGNAEEERLVGEWINYGTCCRKATMPDQDYTYSRA